MPSSWCHTHNTEEYLHDRVYRVCSECGHVYDRGRDVVEAHNDVMAETIEDDEQFLAVDEVADITTCPMCGADW